MDRHRPPVKYHGLRNQGATCYLNSVLQVLFMTKAFRKAVGRQASAPDFIDRHLSSLFDALMTGTAHTTKITNKLGIHRVHEQHDAAANLEKILSHTSREASQIFQGQLTHKNKCSKCGDETTTDEPFWSLPLALLDSASEDYSVVDGIKDFFKDSHVSAENQVYCEACESKADATITCDVKHHPEVLTLLLKRFTFDYTCRKYVKSKCSVEIPYTLQIPEAQTYELYAFVEHFGELKGGHYTVTIRSQDDDQWYNFNDTFVTQLGDRPSQVDDNMRFQSAYLLFYRKMPAGYNSKTPTPGASKQDARNIQKQRKHTARPEKEREAAGVNLYDVGRQEDDEKRVLDVRGDKDGKTGADKHGVGHGNNESVGKVRQKRPADEREFKPEISDEAVRYQPPKHRKLSSENHHNNNVTYHGDERLDSGRQNISNQQGRQKQYADPHGYVGKQSDQWKRMPDAQSRTGPDEREYARGSGKQNKTMQYKPVVNHRGDNRGDGDNQQNKHNHHQGGINTLRKDFPSYVEDQRRPEREDMRDLDLGHRGERESDQDHWQLRDHHRNTKGLKQEVRHKEPFGIQHLSGSKGQTENQRVSTHKQIKPHEQYKKPGGDIKHDARSHSVHPAREVENVVIQSSHKTRTAQGVCDPGTLQKDFQNLHLKDEPSSEPREHSNKHNTGKVENSDEKKSSAESDVDKTAAGMQLIKKSDTQTKADGENRDQSGKKRRQQRKGRKRRGGLLCVPCQSSANKTSESD